LPVGFYYPLGLSAGSFSLPRLLADWDDARGRRENSQGSLSKFVDVDKELATDEGGAQVAPDRILDRSRPQGRDGAAGGVTRLSADHRNGGAAAGAHGRDLGIPVDPVLIHEFRAVRMLTWNLPWKSASSSVSAA
jgi:hypothetical protein